jgi:ABC-2 type transport system ATP-binding protein
VTNSIQATGLVKVFQARGGSVRALDGVDLAVPQGTVLGLLGPNGAGKTTVVRVLTTLLNADAGTAHVAGFDVARDPDDVRSNIGLSGQYSAVDEYLTGRENLTMIGRLYHLSKKGARSRAEELLDRFGLTDAADRNVKGYSGGMRRRLDLAGALVAQPPVLFLDEPTTGLDPRSRLGLWEVISELVQDGTTLLLTTQYLEEADKLADKIAVIDHGRVIARGTADELKANVGGEHLDLVVESQQDLTIAGDILSRLGSETPQIDDRAQSVSVKVSGGAQTLVAAVRELDAQGVHILDVGLRRPTLDDVFLSLTGQPTEAQADAEEEIT